MALGTAQGHEMVDVIRYMEHSTDYTTMENEGQTFW